MLYGHRRIRAELTDAEIADVRRVCRAAAEAYARLIAVSKRGQTLPPPTGAPA
jgi:Xaa-Pro aminopeptidase